MSQLAAQTDRLDALLAALVAQAEGAPGGVRRCAAAGLLGGRLLRVASGEAASSIAPTVLPPLCIPPPLLLYSISSKQAAAFAIHFRLAHANARCASVLPNCAGAGRAARVAAWR